MLGSYRGLTEVVAARAAHPRLTGYVLGYAGLDLRMRTPLRRLVVASAAPTITIDFDEAIRSVHTPGGAERTAPSPVFGVMDKPVDVELSGTHYGIGIRLTPCGAFSLLDLPMRELVSTQVPLDRTLDRRQERRLADQLASAPCWSDRFDLLDRLLPGLLAAGPAPSEAVLRAWQRLAETSGQILVSSLADASGLGRRRLEELFREQIGVTPKAAARILRFHKAFRLITDETRQPALATVAAVCGYSDQAHLTREVRAFAGRTPRSLRPRDTERAAACEVLTGP
ncbi:helix-turn-helix domain-containing protein [Streptomyces sp. NPDC052396]|uniref:helix-turn-helix domain-containing protein n=1 Tax=Streptomyces sp. NPDC052396 TaxID=3365689 RepID=UPI0037D3E757